MQISSIASNPEAFVAFIDKYTQELSDVEDNLRMSGKTLDKALSEQATWPIYYSQRKAELKSLLKYLDVKVSEERGKHARRYVENYSRQLGERVMNSYIDAEGSVLRANELYLTVEELHDKYAAVVDAFEKRGFALRDLTSARVHNIQNSLL